MLMDRDFSRRKFLELVGSGSLVSLLATKSFAADHDGTMLYWAPEWAHHARSVMTLCDTDRFYGRKWAAGIRKEQLMLAGELSRYEPVLMLVTPEQESYAESAFEDQQNVTLQLQPHFDIWARDTLPIFAEANGKIEAVGLNFNVWGNKFSGVVNYDKDRDLARSFCEAMALSFRTSLLVAEGGAIDVNGEGTLLTTRSCLLNPNRNPSLSPREVEEELMHLTGSTQVIWLEGSSEGDITDGHIDGYARFVDGTTVIAEYVDTRDSLEYDLLKKNIAVLTKSRNADGKQLTVVEVARPRYDKIRGDGVDFATNYVNFYIANGVVLMAEFGDDTHDADAHHLVQRLFPSRTVLPLNVDNICRGGGGIHCSLMQMAAV